MSERHRDRKLMRRYARFAECAVLLLLSVSSLCSVSMLRSLDRFSPHRETAADVGVQRTPVLPRLVGAASMSAESGGRLLRKRIFPLPGSASGRRSYVGE